MSIALLHTPAQVLRKLLIDGGLGVAGSYTAAGVYSGGSWPVFATGEPSTPDNCITLTDTVGTLDGRSMVDGELWQHYGFQVRVRSAEHDVGWVKAAAIRVFLSEGVYGAGVALEGSSYVIHCVAGIGMVLPLGRDIPKTMRKIFTLNAKAPIRKVS